MKSQFEAFLMSCLHYSTVQFKRDKIRNHLEGLEILLVLVHSVLPSPQRLGSNRLFGCFLLKNYKTRDNVKPTVVTLR